MSWWTYVSGVIRVGTPARTTEQAEYIVKSVLNHQPRMTGSEGDMRIKVVPSLYIRSSQDWDEFGNTMEQLRYEHLEIQESYLIILEGNLRDKTVQETYREFIRWLCRLSKRLGVDDICVKISDHVYEEKLITNAHSFSEMYETQWVERIAGKKWWEEITCNVSVSEA